MKVYKMYNEVNGYASIDFSDVNMSDIVKGTVSVRAISDKNLVWDPSDNESIKGDCPFYIGAFPVFEATKIKDFDFENAETASFKVEGKEFIAVAAPILPGQLIDKEKSDLRLFKSGKIMNVRRFALKSGCSYPPIFRLEEYPLYTFVCEEMMKSLQELGLTQLKFEVCE